METRPWGWYEVLHDGDYKVKRIGVSPGKRLSLQSHRFRDECWYVVRGGGQAVVGDNVFSIHCGSVISISRHQKHRLINDSEGVLEIVEVQTGDYFGEDDIIRYEDDFGRAEEK